MNYAKERELAKKKHRKVKIIVLSAVAVLIAVLTVVSCFIPTGTWKYKVSLPKVGVRADGELRIHFVDVGQGDATVIELPDGKNVLIDGGDDTEKTKVALLRYLNALKIETIDYLIVTHADADHCGGLDEVLKYKQIRQAYVPNVNPSAGVQYQEFYSLLEQEKCEITTLYRTGICKAETSGYTLSVLYPYPPSVMGEVNDDNDASGVIWLDYHGVSTVFMGDAPATVEGTLKTEAGLGLLDRFAPTFSETEIIKLSHHGSNSASSAEFLQSIQAETAIISCGKNNVYGHPHEEVLQRLEDEEITAYRTDTQGNIIVSVSQNGTGYTVKKSKE